MRPRPQPVPGRVCASLRARNRPAIGSGRRVRRIARLSFYTFYDGSPLLAIQLPLVVASNTLSRAHPCSRQRATRVRLS
jgi:hypothetical protein